MMKAGPKKSCWERDHSLTGDLQVTLKDGAGTLGELTFTDNSSWIRSRKLRLGLTIAAGLCEGMRIRKAKTEAFTVEDHRGECRLFNFLLIMSKFILWVAWNIFGSGMSNKIWDALIEHAKACVLGGKLCV
ncbi:hypothetical protein RHMOL_Rhmol02G0226800 [Rhododendron molle]|uniref:Uncharacterized protein n=1 Tax=Rhododendron molle TaxID=49168 RepID=A0ACC0PVU3_RHOML|nr:hypothetical protein RHMOL_Rhmol02G0226800 [Rhododendron molle]